MNQRKLTEVALIILGLYALIRGLNILLLYFPTLSVKMVFSWTYFPFILSLFIPPCVFWIMGGMLIWYAPIISGKLYGVGENQESADTLHIHEWYRLAFSITGIVLFFWVVLPGLISGTISLLFPLELKESAKDPFGFLKYPNNIFYQRRYGLLGTLVEGGIAIFLVIRAKQLAEFIVRLHNRQPNVSS